MDNTPNYIGLNGYVWWYGVVENRLDPLMIGRCQVRIYGFHSEDKSLIPTEDLMWASGAYGLDNTSPSPPKEGSLVQGYFIDGKHGQFPVMTHVIPGIPESVGDIQKGFSDQRTEGELINSPRPLKSRTYNTDGTGVVLVEETKAQRNPSILNESTISRLARNDNISETFVQVKKNSRTTGVTTASGGTWDEPLTPYDSVYPWNRVVETESGNIIELDDTPGAERIHIAHRSGSFIEVHPNGDVVVKDVKKKYEIVMSDNHLYIMGESHITVKGDSSFYAIGNHTMKVDGNLFLNVTGNVVETVVGDTSSTVNGNMSTIVSGEADISASSVSVTAESVSVTAESVDVTAADITVTSSGGIGFVTAGIFSITASAIVTSVG